MLCQTEILVASLQNLFVRLERKRVTIVNQTHARNFRLLVVAKGKRPPKICIQFKPVFWHQVIEPCKYHTKKGPKKKSPLELTRCLGQIWQRTLQVYCKTIRLSQKLNKKIGEPQDPDVWQMDWSKNIQNHSTPKSIGVSSMAIPGS
jgi:hypothetical protein